MLGNKFKEVISNIEKQIKNKEDLEFVKKQITELTMSYLNELEKIEQTYDLKVANCTERIDDLEKALDVVKEQLSDESM